MNNTRLSYLFELQISKKANDSEKDELMTLLADERNEEQAKVLFAEVWDKFDPSGTEFSAELSKSMLQYVLAYDAPAENRKKLKLWPKIAVAAAAVATIVFGAWFFNYRGEVASVPRNDVVVNDVAPGKNGATITMGNGKVIALSDKKTGVIVGKELKYSDGAAVQGGGPDLRQDDNPINKVQNLTASTARGQTYQFILPDGTKVWLNADSKISFPSQFSGQERKILLSGEGYFEVSKDKAHPFIVEGGGQQVKVLGTHFNINNYADESSVKTTLLEGSVEVSTPAPEAVPAIQKVPGMRFRLEPGQQTIYDRQKLKVREVNIEEAVSWKSGYFVFSETPLENVMRQVERWYNVDVVYADAGAKTRMLGGTALRSGNLSVILKTLESTGAVAFKIEGRKIIVK